MIKRIEIIWKGVKAIDDWIASGGMLVGFEQATNRKEICLKCPKNKSGGFWDLVARTLAKQIPLPGRPENRRLKICQVCHCALRVKVQIPLTSILLHTTEDELKSFPDNCWIVKELQ